MVVPENITDLVNMAKRGASLYRGSRESYALLASMVGVQRSQPIRWMRGTATPRMVYRKRMEALAKFYLRVSAAGEQLRQEMSELEL